MAVPCLYINEITNLYSKFLKILNEMALLWNDNHPEIITERDCALAQNYPFPLNTARFNESLF